MSRNKITIAMLFVALLLGAFSTVTAQGNVLTIWADGTRAPVLQDLADDVAADLGIELNIVQVELGDARDQLLTAGPVGEGPDLLIIPHDQLGQLVANGAIVPLELDDATVEQFNPAALNLFTFEGDLWGLPYSLENIALVRNTELVPEAPATWQEVRALAETFEEEGTADYAFLVQTGDAYHNFPITSAFGGYIFGRNEDGSFDVSDVGLNSEGGLAAAEWLGGMYADGLMIPNVNDDVLFSLFEEGELGMFITGPWNSGRIIDTGMPYEISAFPGAEGGMEVGAPFGGGQGFLISAFSENQLLAEIFLLDYVATPEFMTAMFEADPRLPAFASVDTVSDPNIDSFVAAGENSIPMPAIPEMSAVWGAAGDALTNISNGEEPVETMNIAVEQIQDSIGLLNAEERIVGLPGSYQAAVGCDGDWQPSCSVTFMEGGEDGLYTLTLDVPAGEYEFKVAMNGAWDENYGADGVRDGDNVVLVLEEDSTVTFSYDDNTNVVTFEVQ